MSKGNMFLGYARGKVGSVIFSRRKGEQITRARNTNPLNPRTNEQQFQRAKLAYTVQMYKLLYPILKKFAFEDKKYNESDYNAFVRSNVDADVAFTTKEQKKEGLVGFAPVVVASGSLGYFSANLVQARGAEERNFFPLVSYPVAVEETLGIKTEAQLASILINKPTGYAYYQDRDFEVGDLITFISVSQNVSIRNAGEADASLNYSGGLARVLYSQYEVDVNSASEIPDMSGDSTFESMTIVKIPSGTSDAVYYVGLVGALASSVEPSLNGAIVTRKVGDKILATNSILESNGLGDSVFGYFSDPERIQECIKSYGATGTAILSPDKTLS